MDAEQYAIMAGVEDRHWWYVGMRAIAARVLAAHLDGQRARDVLDVGCGTGGNLPLLERFGRVTGFDISPLALDFAARRGTGARLIQASANTLPFADRSFDLATTFDVLYHEGVDDLGAMREIRRALRPGGKLLIRLPAYEWLTSAHDRAVATARRYTAGDLRRKLEQAGLSVERVSYANSLLFPPALATRLVERWWNVLGSDLRLPSPPVNRILAGLLAAESAVILRSGLPFGLSVLAVASRPSG